MNFERAVPWCFGDETELFRGAVVKFGVGLGDEEEAVNLEADLGWEDEEGRCATFDDLMR